MSTPFQAPDTEPERHQHEVHGTTKFTVKMMRSLRWIRVFHAMFGLGAGVLGLLSMSCGALMLLPQLTGTIPPTPGLPGGMMAAMSAMYGVAGVVYLVFAVWLVLGAWHLQLASTADDATVHVERALTQVVRLWVTLTIAVVAVLGGYAVMVAFFVSRAMPVAAT